MKIQNKKIKISLINSLLIAGSSVSIPMSDGTIAADIKDIKLPLYFPVNWKLRFAIASAIFLSAAFLAIYFVIKRSSARKLFLAPPPHEIAYKALEDLKSSDLVKNGMVKEYFFRLSFIVRQYLENRFHLRAPEMTTEEFLVVMKDSGKLDGSTKTMLKDFLEKSDMVKFAKYGPTANEILGAFAAAKELVDQTKEETNAIS